MRNNRSIEALVNDFMSPHTAKDKKKLGEIQEEFILYCLTNPEATWWDRYDEFEKLARKRRIGYVRTLDNICKANKLPSDRGRKEFFRHLHNVYLEPWIKEIEGKA